MTSIVRLFILLVALCVVANAQTPEQTAKAHYEQGKALTAAGKLAEAYKEFEAGYEVVPRPAFLFNMGEAARAMRDWEKARSAYDRFLAVESTGSVADTARLRLADIEKVSPRPAPVTEPVVVAPAPQEAPRVPTPREAAENHVAATPTVTGTQPTDEERPIWKKWPFWAAVGGAVVAGIVIAVAASGDDGPSCNAGCIDLR